MWARAIELALACWLAISPFIFDHPSEETLLWTTDFASAFAIGLISSLALWPRLEKLHYLNLAVAAYLIGLGVVAVSPPPPPAYQNYVVVGVILLIFAIIPTPSDLPPRSWQMFYVEQVEQQGAGDTNT